MFIKLGCFILQVEILNAEKEKCKRNILNILSLKSDLKLRVESLVKISTHVLL